MRKASNEINRQAGKIDLLEQEHRLKFQLIQETTQQEIKNFFNEMGYETIDYSNIEDLIRVSNEDYPNILNVQKIQFIF